MAVLLFDYPLPENFMNASQKCREFGYIFVPRDDTLKTVMGTLGKSSTTRLMEALPGYSHN
jgi:hypothetical protein